MSKFSPHLRAVLQALFVTFLWSTSWVLIKFGLGEMPPLVFAGLRYMLAFLVLLPFLWREPNANKSVLRVPASVQALTRGDWGRLVAVGRGVLRADAGVAVCGVGVCASSECDPDFELHGRFRSNHRYLHLRRTAKRGAMARHGNRLGRGDDLLLSLWLVGSAVAWHCGGGCVYVGEFGIGAAGALCKPRRRDQAVDRDRDQHGHRCLAHVGGGYFYRGNACPELAKLAVDCVAGGGQYGRGLYAVEPHPAYPARHGIYRHQQYDDGADCDSGCPVFGRDFGCAGTAGLGGGGGGHAVGAGAAAAGLKRGLNCLGEIGD